MDEIDLAAAAAPAPGCSSARNLGRKVYVRHGPQMWDAARRLYASGMTAGDVARTLDLSISAIRVAAARGGWTRRHLAASAVGEAPSEAVSPAHAAAPDQEGSQGDGPTWFRLSADAWLMIRGEYLGGATAKALSQKWGVSATSIYRHASQEGWTKADRGAAVGAVLIAQTLADRTFAERAGARASDPADPLSTAEGLLRLGAGAAAGGLDGSARRHVGLAQDLVRCARQLDAARRRSGDASVAEDEAREAQAQAQAAEHPRSRERVAARAVIVAGFFRLRLARGRRPPQRLPSFLCLEDHAASRHLAEALELVDERGRVECRDFDAAVEAARARGRGELIDRALTELAPWEHCTWLTDEQKIEVRRREAAEALPAPAVHVSAASRAWRDEPEAAAPAKEEPERHIGEGWAALRPPRPTGLSTPLAAIGVYPV
ncbi:hypothetical protein BH09PSE2_BH09PSE2_08920 [soil metagenome]